MNIRIICFGSLLTLSEIFIFSASNAQSQHPYCLQALSELRSARSILLQFIDGKAMTHNEKEALRQINVIIRDINQASPDNGGEVENQTKLQVGKDDETRLQQCIKLLKKAKDDLSHEQDSQFAGGLRDRSVKNCEEAIKFVEQNKHS
jgi:hypothetical protein